MGLLSRTVAGLSLPCCLFYFFCRLLPESRPVDLPPLPATKQVALLPLDSRPVCTELPQELGALAGYNVILPPKESLDNYERSSQREKLRLWLRQVLPQSKAAVISSDNFLLGGLIGARSRQATEGETKTFLRELKDLEALCPATDTFAIVPRLWVQAKAPASWYGYNLYRYNLSKAAADLGSFRAAEELKERRQKIPAPILAAYLDLYRANENFVSSFLAAGPLGGGLHLVGQDDSEPLTLSSAYLDRAAEKISVSKNGRAALTYGADEAASLLLARRFLKERRARLKVYVRYAHPSLPYLYLPYMALTVSGSVADKMALLGLEETKELAEADFCLYISCGHAGYRPGKKEVQEAAELLKGPRPLALVDLSADYEEEELLLPLLLKEQLPLLRLGAFAGWNTCGNSVGSALAEAAVFTLRRRELSKEELPRFYAQNAVFLCRRFLDDHFFQKILHPRLRPELEVLGTDPAHLDEKERAYAQWQVNDFIKRKAKELLYFSLGRRSFYEDEKGAYYLRDLNASAVLPWPRIFEAKLRVRAGFGLRPQGE